MGFFEIVVIAVVGLLVVGPQKLPDTIKYCVVWYTRIKHAMQSTRDEIEQQIGVDELRRELHNERIMNALSANRIDGEQVDNARRSAEEIVKDVNQRLQEIKDEERFLGDQPATHGKNISTSETHRSDSTKRK